MGGPKWDRFEIATVACAGFEAPQAERRTTMRRLLRKTEAVRLSSIAVAVACAVAVQSQEHAPLPEQVLSAETIYLSNDSGDLKAFDAFYRALRKWGRFRIVTSKDKADLVGVLTTTEMSGAVIGTATSVGTANGATSTGSSVSIPRTFLKLRLLDRETGESVWADSEEKWLASGHAPSKLVDHLKARVPRATRP
jgi:hypothetical protein